MNDYISRQAAIERINEALSKVFVESSNLGKKILEKIPSADIRENVIGVWEEKPDPYGFFKTVPVCSACGCIPKFREVSLFCPNCGCKMSNGESEEARNE